MRIEGTGYQIGGLLLGASLTTRAAAWLKSLRRCASFLRNAGYALSHLTSGAALVGGFASLVGIFTINALAGHGQYRATELEWVRLKARP